MGNIVDESFLKIEESIVWVDDISKYEYVRQALWLVEGHYKPVKLSRSQNNDIVLVGYAVNKANPYYSEPKAKSQLRRVFYVTQWDRALKPDGTYKTGCPCEAVDPLTVRPGHEGSKNSRTDGIARL